MLYQFYETINSFAQYGAKVYNIGKSYLGNEILCVEVGQGEPKLIIQYSIHAREYITTELSFLQIKKALGMRQKGTIYFIPITNPDGVLLATNGIREIKSELVCDELIEINGGDDFSLWKANARGVDINVNFPALWGQGEKNITTKNSENYIGCYAGSECETQHLMRFTRKVRPRCTISYHSKGNVIYYEFLQNPQRMERDKKISKLLSQWTGYTVLPRGNSCGGYKDWCIQQFKIPSFTIEVGDDNLLHPIKKEQLPIIWRQNEYVVQNMLALFS